MDCIIFDWKRTLYDPDNRVLISGAVEALQYLQQRDMAVYLVGKGGNDMRDEVNRLGVGDYFTDIVFVGEGKEDSHFEGYISQTAPAKTLVIGDRLSAEIEVGNRLGATTIQVKRGKFAKDLPQNEMQNPDVVVNSLEQLLAVLREGLED